MTERPRTDPLATTALVLGLGSLVCGALTGVPAIVLGVLARRRADREGADGAGVALGGIATGLFGSLVTTTALGLILLHGRPHPPPPPARAPIGHPGTPFGHPPLPGIPPLGGGEDGEDGDLDPSDRRALEDLLRRELGPQDPTPEDGPPGEPAAPRKLGAVTVIDGGADGDPLARVRQELVAARKAGEKVLVVGGGRGCDPCARFAEALESPTLQRPLAGRRVVIFDTAAPVTRGKLLAAGFDVLHIPAFFTVDDAARPTRRIDGGAWGEDTPENIAPVLERFLANKAGKAVTGAAIVPPRRSPVDRLLDDDDGPHL